MLEGGGLESESCADQLAMFGGLSPRRREGAGGRGEEKEEEAEDPSGGAELPERRVFGCALLIKCSLETDVRIKRRDTINIHGA